MLLVSDNIKRRNKIKLYMKKIKWGIWFNIRNLLFNHRNEQEEGHEDNKFKIGDYHYQNKIEFRLHLKTWENSKIIS